MGKPAILAVDDDPGVLGAVDRDLKDRFGERYRVVAADSGAVALDTLRELKVHGDQVALLVADQRMPAMSGVEFIAAARDLYPDVKRVLLTAYADTDAAINEVSVDYYLLKPWDPPEERLYPILEDLLLDWAAGHRPAFEGVRVVGHRWSATSHEIRDFLGRNQVPYQWLDVETSEEGRRVLDAAGPDVRLPLVLLPGGEVLSAPSIPDAAARIGMKGSAELPFYDLVVVGGGPAGLAAAVYGASEGLDTLLIEREAPGGQAGMSSRIENYLGFPAGLSGSDLARRALVQAKRLGAEILAPRDVSALRIDNGYKIVSLVGGDEISARALILANGVSYRRLQVPGAERLANAGVFYGAAMSEAANVAGEDIHIVGGANSAGQAAVFFSRHARSVTMLVRGESLGQSMSYYLIEQIREIPNIEVLTGTAVVGVEGETSMEAVRVRDASGEERTLPGVAMFIFIGAVPRTDWLDGVVSRDHRGFVLTGRNLTLRDLPSWPLDRAPYMYEASIPGIFAAGDVRYGSVKRVASAVGEGSIAVSVVHRYLSEG